jgi:hypothetical protein
MRLDVLYGMHFVLVLYGLELLVCLLWHCQMDILYHLHIYLHDI